MSADALAPVRAQLAAGDFAAAERTCDAAIARDPADARAHGLLAHVLQRAGRHEDALAAAGRSLALAPDFAPSLLEQAAAARALQRFPQARAALERLVALSPARAALHYDLGGVLQALGEGPAARDAYARALALDPRLAEAELKLGLIDLEDHDVAGAYARFVRCTEARPEWVEAWIERADCLSRLGEFQDAIVAAQRAVTLAPDRLDALRAYGNALLGAKKDYAEWIAVKERMAKLDASPKSRVDLAIALWEGFFYREAAGVLDAAIEAFPDHWPARWARFQYPLEVFPDSDAAAAEFLASWRAGFADIERRIGADPGRADARHCLWVATNFYLHYLGQPFLDEQRRYGALLNRVLEHGTGALKPPKPIAPPGARRRIGFVSAFLRRHTIGKLFGPVIAGLDRTRFEVHAYMPATDVDDYTDSLRREVDHLHAHRPDAGYWLQYLADAELDVLVFLDVGMHPLAQVLAARRSAPVQCVTWGHPITTGLSTIDYFLSSAAMEAPDADRHYTETLVRLPNLGIAYEPPKSATALPVSLTPNPHAEPVEIFFAQSVYKITPVHDEVFARIAAAVPGVRFHLTAHSHKQVRDQLAARMRRAFEAHGLDLGRHVVMHPGLPLPSFLGLAASCDLNLDSIGWSGGNTTLEILWHDVPTITLPGTLMRARHTLAMLELLELPELVARDVDDYVRITVALARDRARRAALRQLIAARKHRLYRDPAAVAAWSDFLATVVPPEALSPTAAL